MLFFRRTKNKKTEKLFRIIDGIYSPVRKENILAIQDAVKKYHLKFFNLNLKPLLRLVAKRWLNKNILKKSPKAVTFAAVVALLFAFFIFFLIFKTHANVSTFLAQWTDQADFENNASTINTAATKLNVDTSGTPDSVKLSTASSSITQTDDGITNTGFNLPGYSHNQTILNGAESSASVQLAESGSGGNFGITSGNHGACAVKGDGTVYCWGYNATPQLGDNTTTDRHTPVYVCDPSATATDGTCGGNYFTDVKEVVMGLRHACALKNDGTLYCWGYNNSGQLGDGTSVDRQKPVKVCSPGNINTSGNCGGSYLTNVSAISAGDYDTCAVKSDGTAYCWGANAQGQLGNNTTTNKVAPAQVCAAGTTDTSGTCGGAGHYLTGISKITAAYRFTCALTTSGGAYCWGANNHKQLGDGSTSQRNIPVQVNSLSNVVAITAGGSYGDTATCAASTSCGNVCALKNDGSVYCWGYNNFGQLGDGTTTERAAPTLVGSLSGISSISTRYHHTCAVETDGSTYCWGYNNWGELGNGSVDTNPHSTPAIVNNFPNVGSVSSGDYDTCAVRADGRAYCWGLNTYGQIGDNSTTQRTAPAQVLKGASSSADNYINLSLTTYYSSGTFTSGVIDLIVANDFEALSWILSGAYAGATFKVRTSPNADMSGATDWGSCGDISNGALLTSGSPNCVTVGDRYLQYQAALSTSNDFYTTSLDSVTINYSGAYSSSGTIAKLLMDAGAQAVFTNINWNGTNTANTAIKFRTRGITDAQCTSYGSCSSAWTALSPTLQWSSCDGTSGLNTGLCSGGFYTVSNAYITANNTSSTYPSYRYLEVELTLTTSNGGESPQLNDFMVGYKKNTPPTVAHDITPVQGSDGLVHLTYDVSDADTAEGINHPGYTDVSFQYWDGSAWQTASSFLKPDKVTPAAAADGVGHVVVSDSASTFDLYWNAKADAPNLFLNNTGKIKITANDGEALNNTASSTSSTFLLDTQNPVPGPTPIKINATTDPATLTLSATDNSALQMKIGFASDLSDASSWSAYSANTTLSLPDDPSTVYVQFKDTYNNASTIRQLTTIETPSNLVIRDVSNVDTNTYALFLAWKSFEGTDFKQYDIYRAATTGDACPESGSYSLLTTIADKNTNYHLDPNLSNANTYCYKIVNEDTNGDASFYSVVVYKKPNGQGGTDNTPPAIVSVQVSSTTTQSATIQWDTDELSNSNVDYSTSTNFSNAPDIGVSSMKGGGVGLHKVTLTNLMPGTDYYFQVKSTDPTGNTVTDNNNGTYYTFSTLPGAAISHVTTAQVNNNDATIVWDTDIPADSSVIYSPNPDLSLPTDFRGSVGPTLHHSVIISNLTQGSKYYYYVKSVDSEGNVATDDNAGSYYYFTTDNDLLPPVISQVAASVITDTGALITWTTDERSSSRVEFGTAPSTYTDSSVITDLNTSHAVSLTGLAKNTTYYYHVVSTDANSNTATSAESNFTTLEKQVSHSDLADPGNPSLTQKSDTEAVITLPTTNTDSISRLCYSTDLITDMDNCANPMDVATPTRIHSYHLTNLTPETLYYARVKIIDSENPGISFTSADTFSFTTLIKQVSHATLTDPGDPAVTQKSDTEAVITLPTANTDSTSKICYDTDDITDMDNCVHSITISDPTRIHSYHLTGLEPSTTYFIKTKIVDSENASLSFISNSVSFVTAKGAEFNHDPLSKITDVSDPPIVLTDKNAVISFNTDQLSLCMVTATTAQGNYDNPIIYQENGFSSDPKKGWNMHHSIPLTDLIFSTTYYYKIHCEDNLDTAIQSEREYDFTTLEKQFSESGWGELLDRTPPVISNIKTSALTGESVTVTWDTDEVSNSLVRYGINSNYGNMAGNDVNSSPTSYTKTHSVVINNLIPATAYVFKVISYDASGNMAEGSEQSFTTDAPSSISSIQVVSTSLNQATITWKTSVKTTSSIEYGLKETYGQIKEDTAMAEGHSITLSGLQSGATYHYRVKGKDKDNNLYASADNTFIPKSPPQIAGLKIDNITEHSAVIKFDTNVPTDALITFTDPTSKDKSGSQGKSDLITSHGLTLTNLAPGTAYAITIRVRDQDGNETTQTAPDLTTGKDMAPPEIDDVLTDSALALNDTIQTIISWNTDEPATTALIYRENPTEDEKETKVSDSYTTSHIAVSTVFKPGMVYYFKVKSVDETGNEAVSQDFSLLTPKRKENIIQIIISNFQGIFGWMKF